MLDAIDSVYRTQSRRVLATLIRLLGDFDLAEEALHDAVLTSVERWPAEGMPANPYAWLVSVGRFKAIDRARRASRMEPLADRELTEHSVPPFEIDERAVADDQLRLIFTCCHPALSADAQIALTLREVCGLTTEEVARAFLTPAPTIAQRIVRAKSKIRDAKIPYEMPSRADLPERLESVLHVVYLVFNEGYLASSGDAATRPDVSGEAIRLGRLLAELLPEPEVLGLLALMLLHESRRPARTSANGELVLLEDQDRAKWDSDLANEGIALVHRSLASRPSTYAIQAAISAVHAEAPAFSATDWPQIVGLYDALLEQSPSPVVELNRAVAVAMAHGPARGLELIDELAERGTLERYHLLHAARADLLHRLGRNDEARTEYQCALGLATQPAEKRFLENRLTTIGERSRS